MSAVEEQRPAGELVAGRYRIVGTVGVGGSGTVYRAERVADGQPVALKLMHAEHPEGDVERQRFAREAETVKKLEHAHIVRLLDYGHNDDDTPFLVFPLLQGQSLERKLRREGKIAPALAGRLSIQVLRALEKAHGVGIAHRDIKPPNIFLCASPFGEIVQLLDFGLARVMQSGGAAEVTRIGGVVGTPRYMAPEQVRGERVGPTADIYSLGLVLAEMLLGRPVVNAETELDIYVAHGSDQPLELPADILGSAYGAIVQRAVAKKLELRYRMASQMLADVIAVVDRLGGAGMELAQPDMEATHVIHPGNIAQLSLPNELSEKLREAFNVLAGKPAPQPTVAESVPSLDLAPEDRPTVPRPPLSESGVFEETTTDMGVPPAGVSAPLALHQRKTTTSDPPDSATTLRVREDQLRRKSSAPPPLPVQAPAAQAAHAPNTAAAHQASAVAHQHWSAPAAPAPAPAAGGGTARAAPAGRHARPMVHLYDADPRAQLELVERRHRRLVGVVLLALLLLVAAAAIALYALSA